MDKAKKPIAVAWIAIAFIFVQPLAMLLLGVRRMQNKREWLKGGQAMLKLSLVFLGLFFLFWLVGGAANMEDFKYSFYLFGAGSIIGLVIAQKMIKKGRQDEKYKAAVETHRMEKVEAIAKEAGVSQETAVRDLRKMIEDGIFPHAQITQEGKHFYLEALHPHIARERTVRCTGCGAKVFVTKNRGGKCEYCGMVWEYGQEKWDS
jgi:hypothetical protein